MRRSSTALPVGVNVELRAPLLVKILRRDVHGRGESGAGLLLSLKEQGDICEAALERVEVEGEAEGEVGASSTGEPMVLLLSER